MKKRQFVKTGIIAIVGNALISNQLFAQPMPPNTFVLPILPYGYDALEPFVDKATMEIHYTKHHQAYVTNLNKAIEGTELQKLSIDDICKNISKYPMQVRNNGGGHYNHSLFWSQLKKNETGKPMGKLSAAIDNKFGSFGEFKDEFAKAAVSRFGSGWAWLILTEKGELAVTSTANQDNPLMDVVEIKGRPLLALDVWEHAYYLKYQNKRADYIAAFWNIINWDEASKRFEKKS